MSILITILCGVLNSVMDVIQTKWSSSLFKNIKNQNLIQFMNPEYSWRNKWLGGDNNNGELFFGSSTIFVFLTDMWHLLKAVIVILTAIIIVTYNPMFEWYYDILVYYIAFTVSFQISYWFLTKQ